MSISRHVLQSKVALRIFVLFVICSLIPVSALAYFALSRVSAQLRQQAEHRMRQSCKSAGLDLFRRLQDLAADLTMIAAYLGEDPDHGLEVVTRELRQRLCGRFANLILVKSVAGDRPGECPDGELSAAQLEHLRAGQCLILIDRRDPRSKVWMVRARIPREPGKGLLYGEIATTYLLEGGGLAGNTEGLMVLDSTGRSLYERPAADPERKARALAWEHGEPTGNFQWQGEEDPLLCSYWTLFMWPQFRAKWLIVLTEPLATVVAPAAGFRMIFSRITILSVCLIVLLSLTQIRRRLDPLARFRQATERIAVNDYGVRLRIKSRDELGDLAGSFNSLAEKMESQVRSMTTLNRIGVLLSSERNAARLVEIILTGAKQLTGAEGGVLYLVQDDGAITMVSLDLDIAGPCGDLASGEPEMVERDDGLRNLVTYTARSASVINIPDLRRDDRFDRIGNPHFDAPSGYRPQSLLSVPLRNHEEETIGVLQLVNARERHSGRIVPFDEESERLTESLASQAAVAITKSALIDGYKRLFDSLAELIGRAIDEKSPYTGDHCRRVPVLTMMLADAACATREGPLAGFDLTPDERYELQIASLLHDCGKVATPVHVVDKATKLEKICDRIEMIDARCEILRRDIERANRPTGSPSGDSEEGVAESAAQARRLLRTLERDREFLRRCNVGSESMSPEDQTRIQQIAARYSWVDRTGAARSLLEPDEVRHLSISKGTLTEEEREIINHHVVATIKMLEALPYPKALRNVPRIVGAHHERMDGKGYPRGLTREEIPVQGRILGIADVFEALTARDRPYKKAKKLSEALAILQSMAAGGHIDPDLFDVFIREKVYLRYASEYLDPEQVDVGEEAEDLYRLEDVGAPA